MLCHFILTRFNLATPGREETHRSQAGWLDRRLSLFEKYCLPSVETQTNTNFKWLIYIDVRTPESYSHYFDDYARRAFVELRRVDGLNFSTENVRIDIVQLSAKDCDWVLTSRLDNDDAISREFVDKLQRACDVPQHCVLNFTRGLLLDRGGLYRVSDRSNAFATLVEPFGELRTVWCRQHTDLTLVAPLRQISAPPMWLQVIHQDNVSNRKRGIRISETSPDAANFPISRDDLARTSEWMLLKENYFEAAWRSSLHKTKNTVRAAFHEFEKATGYSPTEAIRRFHERRR